MGCADMLSVLSMTPMQDNPKSVSLTCPWLDMSRLSGFRSRWMMACRHDNHGEQTHSNITTKAPIVKSETLQLDFNLTGICRLGATRSIYANLQTTLDHVDGHHIILRVLMRQCLMHSAACKRSLRREQHTCVWQYSRASTVSATYSLAVSSSRAPKTRSRLKQSPPFRYSITMYRLSLLVKL